MLTPTITAQAKHTPNVRKILLSLKTFVNHLDDFHAMQALAETQTTHANQYTYAPKGAASEGAGTARSRRAASHRKQQSQAQAQAQAQTQAQTQTPQPPHDKHHHHYQQQQHHHQDPPLLAPPPPEQHPYPEEDTNPLLASRVPPPPTDDELRRLLGAPPLSFPDAAARWRDDSDGARYPPRRFCDVCGYWARIKCAKCGGGVCALDCLETHREECITRYGL